MLTRPRTTLIYAAMIVAAVGVFLWIRSAGGSLVAPVQIIAGQSVKRAPGEPAGVLTHVLLALLVIILCARALGAAFRRFHQPAVVGEMIAGIFLGPSLLGRVLPGVSAYLLPNQVAPYLSVIANVGVILYMFLVGVELNTDLLRARTHASVATSHASIIAPFLLGSVIPHDSPLARDIKQKFEDLILVLFLPTFFAFTGLRTQIGLVHGLRDWLICLVIIGVASLGKFGGAAVAGLLTGLGWREAASIGILMNTRGLMELIVLNVGLDLAVLTPPLFAMLVVMAIITTLATTPVLQALTPEPQPVALSQTL